MINGVHGLNSLGDLSSLSSLGIAGSGLSGGTGKSPGIIIIIVPGESDPADISDTPCHRCGAPSPAPTGEAAESEFPLATSDGFDDAGPTTGSENAGGLLNTLVALLGMLVLLLKRLLGMDDSSGDSINDTGSGSGSSGFAPSPGEAPLAPSGAGPTTPPPSPGEAPLAPPGAGPTTPPSGEATATGGGAPGAPDDMGTPPVTTGNGSAAGPANGAPLTSAPLDGPWHPVGTVIPGKEEDYEGFINAAAEKHGVDPKLIKAVIRQESNFDPLAQSPSMHHFGLMQVGDDKATQEELRDPARNIDIGTAYLAEQLRSKRANGDPKVALAMYNAGPAADFNTSPNGQSHSAMDYSSLVMGWYNELKQNGSFSSRKNGAVPTVAG